MTEFRKVFPASAPLEPTLDESVSAFTGGAYTAKSRQESHYGRSEQTWHRIRPRTLGRWLMLPEADPRSRSTKQVGRWTKLLQQSRRPLMTQSGVSRPPFTKLVYVGVKSRFRAHGGTHEYDYNTSEKERSAGDKHPAPPGQALRR